MTAPPARAAPGRAAAGAGSRRLWTATALAAAVVVALPLVTVAWSLAWPSWAVWAHLWQTQLVELVLNTVGLLLAVSAGALVLGTGLAWLVALHEFPGRRIFDWALVLPLALPAYVIGFVFLGLLDFAGPLQRTLRSLLGPDLRLPALPAGVGVAAVMSLVFYPYVFTLARAAFLEQAPDLLETARTLGRTRGRAFVEVTLPLARPALVAGATLAGMEALADFGTVSTFGYRTLTEAIYRVWHGMFDRWAATQLAAVLVALALGLAALERVSRGRGGYASARAGRRPVARQKLRGGPAVAATGACVAVLGLAFGLPVVQLAVWAVAAPGRDGTAGGLGLLAGRSLGLAGAAALLIAALAPVLGYALRLRPGALVGPAVRLAGLGYALPGAVIAVGVLLPLAELDRALAGLLRAMGAPAAGLLLTGSLAGLLWAYLARFLAVGLQAVEASLARVPASMDDAARALGAGPGRRLRAIHLPLLHRGLVAAAALVFVDVMKELPATLLLRPLGFDTLAVAVWQRTAEALWEEAAAPALAIVAAGLVPVAIILRRGPPAGQVRGPAG